MSGKLEVPIDVLVGAYDQAKIRYEIASTRRLESPSMHDSWEKRRTELLKAAIELGDAMVRAKKEEAK